MSAEPPLMNGSATYPSTERRSRTDSDGSDDQFLDMLAQFQDDRLDDQRCGLPEKAEDENQKGIGGSPVSMVVLPEKGFWSDGWIDGRAAEVEGPALADLSSLSWEIKREEAPTYYRLQFMNKDHDNYYCEDEKLGPLLMSLRCELTSNKSGNSCESWEEYRVIVRTLTETTYQVLSSAKFSSSSPRPEDIVKVVLDQPSVSRMHPATSEKVPDLIARFDEHGMQTKHKFGIVFQRVGQTTEEEMFGNENHGAAMEEFLDLLGERVELQGFTGYAGGLDVKNGTTGEASVYTGFQDREIMFHVSTLLPFKEKGDNQQLERKRHIGNDIVAIVFQNDATPFHAGSITSKFLQAIFVIQAVEPLTEATRYKLSVVAKDGMSNFGPDIPQPAVFPTSDHFRSWLLTKLVNAEAAAKETPQFTKLQTRTRSTLLQNLVDKLKEIDERAEANGPAGRLLASTKSQPGSFPSLGPKRQRHSIDTGVLSHGRNVSPFATTESHDLVMRRQRSGDSPARLHVYKPLFSDHGSENLDSDESRIRREKSKMRRQHLLNRVQNSLHNYERPGTATLPASVKLHSFADPSWKKSTSSYQSPSSDNSSTEQSPNGSLSSLGGAHASSLGSPVVISPRQSESALNRKRSHNSGDDKYGTMSSASSIHVSNPSPPSSESEEDSLLRMVEVLQREVDKLREERLRLLRETVALKRENTNLKKKDLDRDMELRSAHDEISRLKSQVTSLGGDERDLSSTSSDGHGITSSQHAMRSPRSRSRDSQPLSRFQPIVGSRDPHRFDALLGRPGARVGVGRTANVSPRISLSDLEGETTYL